MADFLRLICMAIQNSQVIPPQEEGKQVDIVETIKASNNEEAKLIFRQARNENPIHQPKICLIKSGMQW